MSTNGNPNILLIIADDLGQDVITIDDLGDIDGLPITDARESMMKVHTDDKNDDVSIIGELPNVSRFLRNGVYFNQAWSHPACSPTRASIYTGLHPWKSGVGSPNEILSLILRAATPRYP